MTALAAAVLLALDAAPAGWLAGRLAAAEAAYAHVEAEYRLVTTGGVTTASYLGSRGGCRLVMAPPPARPGPRHVEVYHPGYLATAVCQPQAGWEVLSLLPTDAPNYDGHTFVYAPCEIPFGGSYSEQLQRRTGPVQLTRGERDGRPVVVARVPLPPDGPSDVPRSRQLTLALAADPPGPVLAARVDDPTRPADGPLAECDITYQPGGGWPAVRSARWARVDWVGRREESTVEFTRYRRLDAPPAADRFTLTALGLPEAIGPTQPPLEDRWPQWAVGGIVAAGAVAFILVGRTPEVRP